MAEKSTFIKLDRNITRWQWFNEPKTLSVWIWLMVEAAASEHYSKGELIRRGQVPTCRRDISLATGLSEQSVRTALNHLKSSGAITIKSTSRGSLITLVNYGKYQSRATSQSTDEATNDQPATNQQLTTPKKVKNYPKGRRKKEVCVDTHAPTVDEVVAFFAGRGRSRGDAEKFHGYNTMNGWKVDDWQAAAEMWIRQGADTNGGNREPVMQTTQPAVETDDFGRPIKKPCTLSDLGFNPADYMTEEELNGS